MKITNFRDMETVDGNEYATVDITVGWIFRRTQPKKVYKSRFGSYWRWAGSGKFTPGNTVDFMADAYRAAKIYKEGVSKKPHDHL